MVSRPQPFCVPQTLLYFYSLSFSLSLSFPLSPSSLTTSVHLFPPPTPHSRLLGARNQVTTYNPTTGNWATLPNMTARSAPACAYLSGRLYVFGGVARKANASHHDPDPTIKFALVESIAVSGDGQATEAAWRREPDMPFGPRESPSATTLLGGDGGGIVVAGGFDSGIVNGTFDFEYFNTSYLFDGASYAALPDMPFKRSNMALVATKDKRVYAFGGGETAPSYSTCASLSLAAALANSSTALRTTRELKKGTWDACPPLADARSWAAAGIVGDDIVITGGMGGTFAPTAETDVLSLSQPQNWTDAGCDLPIVAGFLSGAVTVDTKTFVVVAGNGEAYVYRP